MSFIEYETWKIKPQFEEQHHDMIRRWFDFLTQHQAQLFPEWKSMRYYRQVSREGQPTGVYIMLFEYHSLEAHHAYKDRRKDWSGPYAAYKDVDPYQFFDHDTVTTKYWDTQETARWREFPPAAMA